MANEAVKSILSKAEAIILDIEGTIASIDFTRKEAFPYVERNIEDYVKKNWEEVKNTISVMKEQGQFSPGCSSLNLQDIQMCQSAVVGYVKNQMKDNRNDPLMKQIQGLVLQNAFRSGRLRAHIYPDVLGALIHWFHRKKQVYIYSTGSRATQVEYFKHTTELDLSEYIKGYYDTSIGCKLECEGFTYICSSIQVDPSAVVFFSDRPKEIVAAKKSGLKAILVDRETDFSFIKEEKEFLGHEDAIITSFGDVIIRP